MRRKAAQIAQELFRLLTSAGIGYALGRVQQRAHDEGRIGILARKADKNRDAALDTQATIIEFHRSREKDVKP